MDVIAIILGSLFAATGHQIILFLGGLFWCMRPSKLFVSLFLFGYLGYSVHEWWHQDYHMPKINAYKQQNIQGSIVSTPIKTYNKIQFDFNLNKINHQDAQAKLSLVCYQNCPNFQFGQTWQLMVTLKPPHNLQNPGGLDYISILNNRHIHWLGNIHPPTHQLSMRTTNLWMILEKVRHYLSILIRQAIKDPQIVGILEGLTLGLTERISTQQWDLFRHTGTTHLIVISGSHLTIITGLIVYVTEWLWKKKRYFMSTHSSA